MRRRVLSFRFGALLAALALLAARGAWAQPSNTVSLSIRSLEVGDLLRQGQKLEAERRWGDALAHYEDAVRQFPAEAALQRHFETARLHYDLGRRYADRSFLATLSQMPAEEALELYGQVLLKIQAHYVEALDWKELLERGTAGLEMALGEPAFVERNVPAEVRPAIDTFCRELRQALGSRVVESRHEACEVVAAAAALGQQRLGILPTAVALEYTCGAASGLDPFSAYLTPDQLSEVYSQIDGNFVGLGVELKAQDGKLRIVRVIPGSPAEEGGLRPGDCIDAVDGKPTGELSTDEAANLLQGPAGTAAALTVSAQGRPPRQLRIERRRVDVPSIDGTRIVDPKQGIAYLRLTCFQKTTGRDLDAALWKLYREGMKILILDLRGNPGGLLTTAVDVADRFLDRGVVVSTRGRSVQENFTYTAQAAGTWRVPLVLLIDQHSASAAEIVAGAIRDHRRGTIVGQRSYGKGSVQGIFPLEQSHAGLRLTTARFYSPSGRPYSGVGVEPDVVVHQAARPVDGQINLAAGADDAVLAAALEAARKITPR